MSQLLVDRVEDALIWLCCSDFADLFLVNEVAKRLVRSCENVGSQEFIEVSSEVFRLLQ